jgi:hypothetical protein
MVVIGLKSCWLEWCLWSGSQGMLRIGFAGLDSSHCTAFARLLLEDCVPGGLQGARITAGWPGGSADFPLSRDRVQGFTEEMRSLGTVITATVEELLQQCDAVILGSVDGRQHLGLAEQIFAAGKPVFVDKPLAHNLADAARIALLARRYGTRWFTASALRFQAELRGLLDELRGERVVGCEAFGTLRAGIGHLQLAWYGIHGLEVLYAVMGAGCREVRRVQTASGDLTTGIWEDGRVGVFRGLADERQAVGWGVTVFGSASIRQLRLPAEYPALLGEIVRFFQGGAAPVSEAEMLELFGFMEAADASLAAGGAAVRVADCLRRAGV